MKKLTAGIFGIIMIIALFQANLVSAGSLLTIRIPEATIVDTFKIATSGVYYNVELEANGSGTTYCYWEVSEGSLPTGLSLLSTRYTEGSCFAEVSGTPTAPGTTTSDFTITLYGTDQIVSKTFSITVRAPIPTNRHARGSVVVDKNRVVYFLGNDTRYPYPSMEVFRSWGHKQSDIKTANADDLALPIGSPAYLNYKPTGHLDGTSPGGGIKGWAVDRNQPTGSISIDIYFDGPAGKSPLPATRVPTFLIRSDVNQALGSFYSGNYGFNASIPESLWDGKQHTAYAYGIDADDTSGRSNVLLSGSPLKFTLNASQLSRINITSPNGGQVWESDSIQTISWTDTNFDSNTQYYTVFITKQDGGAYGIAADYVKTTSIQWTVGSLMDTNIALPSGDEYYVQVVKQNTPGGVSDQSDAAFTIAGPTLTPDVERDAQRILFAAFSVIYFEDYYAQNKKFPALSELPQEFQEFEMPQPPDGSCSASDNRLVYQPSFDQQNFTLQFCLGTDYFYNEAEAEGKPFLKKGINVWDYKYMKELFDEEGDDIIRI